MNKKILTTAALVAAIIAAPLAPASAGFADWTPRQGWCALVPAWCR